MKILNFFLNFIIFLLINLFTFNFSVSGMQIDDETDNLYVYSPDYKEFIKYDSKYFEKVFNKFKTARQYLEHFGFAVEYGDNKYMMFNEILKNQMQDPKYIFKNNELPNKSDILVDLSKYKLGYDFFYLILQNICLDWQKNHKNIEDLTPNYISSYIKDVLLNARKAIMEDDEEDIDGLLFDGNIFLPYSWKIVFPRFSYDYDEEKCTVTFRFLQEDSGNKSMIQIKQWCPNLITSKPNYEIYTYDEYGFECIEPPEM